MKYIGHVITLIGVGLIGVGLVLAQWLTVSLPDRTIPMNAGFGGEYTVMLSLGGNGIAIGVLLAVLAGIAGALTVASIVLQRRALLISASITFLFLLGVHVWGLASLDRI